MLDHYFQSYNNNFWQWEEKGNIVAIPGGNTIAYKALLADIIEKLADQGLPPFGSLLMAIAAMNPNGEENIDIIMSKGREVWDDTRSVLHTLSELPDEYKKGLNKILVIRAVFERCHGILSLKRTAHIAGRYRTEIIDPEPEPLAVDLLDKDFKVVSLLGRKFPTVQSILERVGELLKIDEELELQETPLAPTDFVEELSQNENTYQVGNLVKTLWAGLNLPVHSTLPSQQPIGGVSDLTNKGNLDQLLISEYANDDLVFLSRLANNEMLYLSRESPPAFNQLQRIILIDVSLKNWGTPKIMALSTLVAIAKHPKTDITCQAFAIGKNLTPLKFDTVSEIIQSLQTVEASLDASEGLKKFFKTYPNSQNREVFVLTEKSTQKQAVMQRTLQEFNSHIDYWILNEADGKMNIFKNLKKSRKHIQQIQIPLQRLWENKPKTKPKTRNSDRREKLGYFPILTKPAQSFFDIRPSHTGELFQVTKDKNLLRKFDKASTEKESGWDLVYENLPMFGDDFEIGILDNGDYMFLGFQKEKKRAHLLNIRTNKRMEVDFPQWYSVGKHSFFFEQGQFVYQGRERRFSIKPDGTLNESEKPIAEHDKDRKTEIDSLSERYTGTSSILKKIRKVGISAGGDLIINSHKFCLNSGGHIKLDATNSIELAIEAEKTAENEFTFPDGSVVEINGAGLATLESSNPEIPTIYFPTVLDGAIAVATEDDFTGNTYYYKEALFEMILSDIPKSKVVHKPEKAIREVFKKKILEKRKRYIFGVEDTKASVFFMANHELLNATHVNTLHLFKKDAIFRIQKDFEEAGVTVEVKPTIEDFTSPEIIEPHQFFQKYITPFIVNIGKHGA